MSIDRGITRYIAVFDDTTEQLIDTVELIGPDLRKLQEIFNVPVENPMYDCWAVTQNLADALLNSGMLKSPLTIEVGKSYFVEASTPN